MSPIMFSSLLAPISVSQSPPLIKPNVGVGNLYSINLLTAGKPAD
jgi:hypothetical protein